MNADQTPMCPVHETKKEPQTFGWSGMAEWICRDCLREQMWGDRNEGRLDL